MKNLLQTIIVPLSGGGGGTSYNGLYGDALPKRGESISYI